MRHITITDKTKTKKEIFKMLAEKWIKWGEGLTERDKILNVAILTNLCCWWAKESVLEKVGIKNNSDYSWSESFVHEPIRGITHDYNLSIIKLKSISDYIEDPAIKKSLIDAINLNQKMFDTAYLGSKELSMMHRYYYEFNHKSLVENKVMTCPPVEYKISELKKGERYVEPKTYTSTKISLLMAELTKLGSINYSSK